MKKILLFMLMMALVLSACSSKTVIQPEATPDVTEEAAQQTPIEATPEPAETEIKASEVQEGSEYPEAFSWKNDAIIMTPQNQDPLGSCAVFAAMSMFETHIAIMTGELPDLSEMHFISTSEKWSNDTGVSPELVLDFVKDEGVVTEDKLPYVISDKNIETTQNNYGYDYMLTVDWGSELLDGNSPDERISIMKQSILEHGPVVTNVALHNDFGYYRSGVYDCNPSSGVAGGHWLVVLGWQDDVTIDTGGYWICKNSWGTQWGEGGYCNIAYGDASGIDDFILYYIDTPKDNIDAALVDLGIAHEPALEAPDADYLDTYSLSELQKDFDLLTDTVLEHNTFTFADRDAFEAMAQQYRRELTEGMNEIEFYRILSKMVSFINCGHSRISLSHNSDYTFGMNNYFMPLDIKFYNDQLYLIGSKTDIDIPLGSEILSINGTDINDIVDEIYTMLPSDGQNTTFKKKMIHEQFYYLYNLLYDNSGLYTVEYVNSQTNTTDTVSFVGIKKRLAGQSVKNIYLGGLLDYEVKDNYVYLRIPNFNTIGGYTIADYRVFFRDFFNEVNALEIPNLMIDVRGNSGGHPDAANILLSYLADLPFQYFASDLPPAYPNLQQDTAVNQNHYKGNVYVICDGGSFSTTGHFLALFQYHNMGYIIGEESGAGHTCTDASFNTTLPVTNMTLRLSSVKWNVAVEHDGEYRGIMPDYAFAPTVDDMINRVDSTLEYAISLINN